MAAKKGTAPETLTLKPSECATTVRAILNTDRSLFMWGPPGISKSAMTNQVATAEDMAFIDVRLSQMDPTDLRGIPYPVVENGVHGVRWSPPMALPRNLNYSGVQTTETDGAEIGFLNPKGDNGVHYCTDPKIEVRLLEPKPSTGATVTITEQHLDRFHVIVKDASGEEIVGKVRYTIKGEVKGILALEEFNSAPPSVAAAAYQLVLDRKLGEGYEVPEGVAIIAMGNRDTDKGITFKMATPISNRFVHIEMRSDFEDWQRWALGSFLNADVVGYLSAFKHHLFDFEPGSAARGFATPRSWHALSDILNANEDLPDMIAMALICGSIGDGIGVQFMEFRNFAADLPKAESILSGQLKKMPKKVDVSLAYALTTTLCYELKTRADDVRRSGGASFMTSPARKQWLIEADNFLEFIMENFQPEICIMGAKAAISTHKLPFDTQKMKHFDTFAGKFKDLIMS